MSYDEGLAAFVAPSRRARFRELLKSRRMRRRLQTELSYFVWSGVGFISCIPGRLGLYIGEDGFDVFVLRRDE